MPVPAPVAVPVAAVVAAVGKLRRRCTLPCWRLPTR
jgi:hypothetical protein